MEAFLIRLNVDLKETLISLLAIDVLSETIVDVDDALLDVFS